MQGRREARRFSLAPTLRRTSCKHIYPRLKPGNKSFSLLRPRAPGKNFFESMVFGAREICTLFTGVFKTYLLLYHILIGAPQKKRGPPTVFEKQILVTLLKRVRSAPKAQTRPTLTKKSEKTNLPHQKNTSQAHKKTSPNKRGQRTAPKSSPPIQLSKTNTPQKTRGSKI